MLAPEDLDRDDSSVAGFDNQVPLKEPPVVKLLVLTCPDSSYDGYGGYGLQMAAIHLVTSRQDLQELRSRANAAAPAVPRAPAKRRKKGVDPEREAKRMKAAQVGRWYCTRMQQLFLGTNF